MLFKRRLNTPVVMFAENNYAATSIHSIENITARLDRLEMSSYLWGLVFLIAAGGCFDTYSLFLTGFIGPGLLADKIFTATTASLFGMTGLASFIAALSTGMFIGILVFSHMADQYGRRTIFTLSLVWFSVCGAIMAFQTTALRIDAWRLLAGIGIGVEMITVDTFITELVPPHARGRVFALQQAAAFLPVPVIALLAYWLVPAAPFGFSGWRWLVLIGSLGAAVTWFVRLRLPESPRWLAHHGRCEEADRILRNIEARVSAQAGPLAAPRPLRPENTPTEAERWWDIFAPRYRRRTVMLLLANIFEPIGFYGFANWAPTLLISRGIRVSDSFAYIVVIAFAYPCGAALASLVADRIERKWQVCLSCLGVAFFGVVFSQQSAAIALILSGFLMTAMGAWLTVAAHGYQPELYPTRIRARGVGFVYAWGRFGMIFTGFVIAAIFRATGVAGVFTFIAGAMAVVITAVGLLGPATGGRSLEHISR